MIYYVYILKCNDGTLYTGITNNIEKRLKAHNKGRGSKYVRSRLPAEMVYILSCPTKSQALKFEKRIKKLTRQKKLDLIQKGLFLQY